MLLKTTKSIRNYFPDIITAQHLIKKGVDKYAQSKKYTFAQHNQPRGNFDGRLYIDEALAAIMYATGKEPKSYDLNTPSESYGWKFDETRDLLNALTGLAKGNPYWWNLYYGQDRPVRFNWKHNAGRI